MNNTPRRPIGPEDPLEVFVEEAKLLTAYSEGIGRDVEDIVARFPDPDASSVVASAYVRKNGWNIPDATIKSAVERLAKMKFRLRGIECHG
jgi:hypothetical protein